MEGARGGLINLFRNLIKHTDMKKVLKSLLIAGLFLTIPLFTIAQTPPPPNNGGSAPGGGNTPVGGGAPIGGGLIIMMVMGVAYGSRKVYKAVKF